MNNKHSVITIILIVILSLLIVINLMIFVNKSIPERQELKYSNEILADNEKNKTKSEENQVKTEEDYKQEKIKELEDLNERDRMQRYCGEYFYHIDRKEYELAYACLFDSFKENYFKTLSEYEEYVKKQYPNTFSIEYNDIERQGNIYILTITISDVKNINNKKVQRIVIQENDFADYKISFQIDKEGN